VLTALATDLDAPFALRLIDHWANATDFGDDTEPGAGDVIRKLVDGALGVQL
jgi:L-cysteine:1D-myo-inositol 2-amino-2-deoxy-alpha-D-glucopyranoside ligase